MKTTVLLFGIATELVGNSSINVELPTNTTVNYFKKLLIEQHPTLKKMSAYAIAINEIYASDETMINESDVIAIIPPVSGG